MYGWKKWRGDPNILYGMARTKVARDALESYEGILGHPFDFLQESISGHKMEHTVAEVDYDTIVYNLGDIIGEINDVFPGAPNGPVTFPRDERDLQSYRDAENLEGDPAYNRRTNREDNSKSGAPSKRKPRSSTGPQKKRRSTPAGTTASPGYDPNAGWHVQPDARDNQDDECGPVQRDIRMWEGIKANLLVLNSLSENLTALANVVREANANMPTMIAWIDKLLVQRAKHSLRMRELRLTKKQLQGTPRREDSAADMLVQLANISEVETEERNDRGSGRFHSQTSVRGGLLTTSSSSSQPSGTTLRPQQSRETARQTSTTAPRPVSSSQPLEGARRGVRVLGNPSGQPRSDRATSSRGSQEVAEVERVARGTTSSRDARIPRRDRIRSRSRSPTEEDIPRTNPPRQTPSNHNPTVPSIGSTAVQPVATDQGITAAPVSTGQPFAGLPLSAQMALFNQFLAMQGMSGGTLTTIQPQTSTTAGTVVPLGGAIDPSVCAQKTCLLAF